MIYFELMLYICHGFVLGVGLTQITIWMTERLTKKK